MQNRRNEDGNAIWFILLAVALLTLLTITITGSSSKSEQSGDIERARVVATDLMRYAKGIEQAVDGMRLRGGSENDICFHATDWGHADYSHAGCADNTNRIFHAEGSGLAFRTFDSAPTIDILGNAAVQGVGTSDTDLLFQAGVSRALCLQINNLLSIPNTGNEPPTDVLSSVVRFAGTYTAAGADSIIGNQAADFVGKNAGCREEGGDYFFYHVLIER